MLNSDKLDLKVISVGSSALPIDGRLGGYLLPYQEQVVPLVGNSISGAGIDFCIPGLATQREPQKL